MKNKSLFILFLCIFFACGEKSYTDVMPEEAKNILLENKELQILDVRTPQEFEQGVLEGAINADVTGRDFELKIAQLDKNRPVLVYCAGGLRSAKAAKILKDKGFKEVNNLVGGLNGWLSSGGQIGGSK